MFLTYINTGFGGDFRNIKYKKTKLLFYNIFIYSINFEIKPIANI